jgi:hypothetical protein
MATPAKANKYLTDRNKRIKMVIRDVIATTAIEGVTVVVSQPDSESSNADLIDSSKKLAKSS